MIRQSLYVYISYSTFAFVRLHQMNVFIHNTQHGSYNFVRQLHAVLEAIYEYVSSLQALTALGHDYCMWHTKDRRRVGKHRAVFTSQIS